LYLYSYNPTGFQNLSGLFFYYLYIRSNSVQLSKNARKAVSVRLSEVEAWYLRFYTIYKSSFFCPAERSRSFIPLSAAIFCFLKEKAKGFPLLSGLGYGFSKKIDQKNKNFPPLPSCEISKNH